MMAKLMPSTSESSADSDQDFDLTAEMLVNDFDDEHTLEEEEAMESSDSAANELDDLQRGGEMPLDELLTMYGYSTGGRVNCNTTSVNDSPVESDQATNEKESVMVPISNLIRSSMCQQEVTAADESPDTSVGTGPLLNSMSQASESSDSESDDDYSPAENWKKTIQVGADFQAVIPEGLCKYDDAPAYENEDRLLWDTNKISDEEVESYLYQAQVPYGAQGQGVNSIPVGNHIKDDEQALFLLLQCDHNVEEALRRRQMQPLHSADTMSLWSEDECRNFEGGLRAYGKDFHLIQQNKVRIRSVGELVQFYYLWKKTERHDAFASKNRLEKKKYALHPGTMDYMEKFIEEHENLSSNRDCSSSPSLRASCFHDNKKRTSSSSPPSNIPKTDPLLNPAVQENPDTLLNVSYSSGLDRSIHLHSPGKLNQ